MKFTNPGQRSKIPSPSHYPLLKTCKLSSKELSEEQIKFLSRGLKFTSSPKRTYVKQLMPISKVFVQLEGKRNRAFQTQRKAWRKRKVTPPRNRNITLENYLDFLTNFHPEIIISKADKGGVVVGYQGLCTGRRNIRVNPVTVHTVRLPHKFFIERLNPQMQIPT